MFCNQMILKMLCLANEQEEEKEEQHKNRYSYSKPKIKEMKCPICFHSLNKNKIARCKQCEKEVHKRCVETWNKNKCPLCMYEEGNHHIKTIED